MEKQVQSFKISWDQHQSLEFPDPKTDKIDLIKGFNNFQKTIFSQQNSSVSTKSQNKDYKQRLNHKKNINIRDKIENLFLEVNIIQEEKNAINQQVQFYLQNFQYILELFKQNITKFMTQKLAKIDQRNSRNIISLQQENKMLKQEIQKYEKKQQTKMDLKLLVSNQQKDLFCLKPSIKQNCQSTENTKLFDSNIKRNRRQNQKNKRRKKKKIFSEAQTIQNRSQLLIKNQFHRQISPILRKNSGQVAGLYLRQHKGRLLKLKSEIEKNI